MTSKILVDRDILVQMLEALQYATPTTDWTYMIEALRVALEEPVQEPVAWMVGSYLYKHYDCIPARLLPPVQQPLPLYTVPPQRKENNEPAAWMMTENPKYGNSVVVRVHKPKMYDVNWWNVEPLYKLGDS